MSDEKPSLGQKIMDNEFILLALGLAFPLIFYFLWGVIELLKTPNAPY